MNNLAPIVLFVYNRPWHTKQTVEALQKNELAQESELFIYSDEIKNEDARKSVNEVRSYIDSIDGFKKVTIIKRGKNWGLADSIIDGVTSIINRYGKIIVLEDDLVTSPYFLKFMNDSLVKYDDEKKVWHISGYTPPFNSVEIKKHFFIKPTSCWGWATWADEWRYFKKDTRYFLSKFDKQKIKDFNVGNTYEYYSHMMLNHKKKLNTWAIFWYATVYLNNGVSLHPKKSFVNNIGHDNSGEHCVENCSYDVDIAFNYGLNDFPDKIELSDSINRDLSIYYKGLKKPILIRVVSKIKKILRKKR